MSYAALIYINIFINIIFTSL